MAQSLLNKNAAIQKLRYSSTGIGVVCILGALFNLFLTIMPLLGIVKYPHDAAAQYAQYRNSFSYALSAVIMALAAVMFFRIAKNGIPFTMKNVRMVRIIAILFLLNAILPSAAAIGISGVGMAGLGALISPTALAEGLLFLFIAHTLRYGAMLQQESDETL